MEQHLPAAEYSDLLVLIFFELPLALSLLIVHGGTKGHKRKNGDGPMQGTSEWRKSVGGCSSLETYTLFIIAPCRYIVLYATFLFSLFLFSLYTLIMETGPVLFICSAFCSWVVTEKVKKGGMYTKNTLGPDH